MCTVESMNEPAPPPTEYLDTRSYFWGWLTRKVVPDKTVNERRPYLIRWHIWLPFGFAIYLHKLCVSDPDRDLHDHPWSFISILVWGRYTEYVPGRVRRVRWFNVRHATDAHRVVLDKRFDGEDKPVYTILLRGRRQREFGFHTEEGWFHWREYNARNEGAEVI